MTRDEAKERAVENALVQMSILQFFPADPVARVAIGHLLHRMAHTAEQVDWLAETMVDSIGVWEGPVALRGVFCSRFRPADGKEEDPPPGLAARNEMRYVARSDEQKHLPAGCEGRKLLGELLSDENPEVQRRSAQSFRWKAVCLKLPNLQKLALAKEFATTDKLERREEILIQAEKAAGIASPKKAQEWSRA